MTDEKRDLPQPSKGDVAHKLLKAGLSGIPLVGGPASELFAMLVAPPLQRRREKWMEEIGEALEKLKDNSLIDLTELQRNEEFLDTVLQATQVALRSHYEEKRAALRGAILNTALGRSPGEALRLMFIGFVDYFTEWHIRILVLFGDPRAWFEKEGREPPELQFGGLAHILEDAFPPLRNSRAIYDQIWKDLHQRGLVNTDSLHTTMTGHGLLQKRVTDLGARFLAFITESD